MAEILHKCHEQNEVNIMQIVRKCWTSVTIHRGGVETGCFCSMKHKNTYLVDQISGFQMLWRTVQFRTNMPNAENLQNNIISCSILFCEIFENHNSSSYCINPARTHDPDPLGVLGSVGDCYHFWWRFSRKSSWSFSLSNKILYFY